MIRRIYTKIEPVIAWTVICSGVFTGVVGVLTLTIITFHALD